MDTKKLRQKILDLAIHGKLVPQDPNDEPAFVLLERIRAEKERLIKEGKIKRTKKSAKSSDTPHYENRQVGEANEVPFEVPDGWVWTTIEDLTINRDAERIPLSLAVRKKQQNKVYDYYGAAGVIDKVEKYLFDERLLLVGEDGANLLSRSKDNAFFVEGKYWVNNHAHVLDCPNKSVLDYVAFVINSMSLEHYITGSAQPKLTQDNLNKIFIPLPPEKEQHKIIESVKDYFSNISLLKDEIDELDSFIQNAKSKILDLAIHGKLVPQDPNDEPAIELLKRINPKFVPCDNAHYPFEIPTTWCLTYVKVIVDNPSCKPFQILQSDINDIGQTPVVSQSSNYIEGYSDRNDCVFQNKNAVLIFGDHTRNLKYVDFNFIVGADGVKIIIPHILVKYSYYALQFIINGMRNRGYARHYSVLANSTIPIPPLAEQHRIVAKIEELFAVLDEIQKSIEA